MTNVRFYFRHKERQRGKHFCFHTLSFRLCNAHKLYFNVVSKLLPYVALAFAQLLYFLYSGSFILGSAFNAFPAAAFVGAKKRVNHSLIQQKLFSVPPEEGGKFSPTPQFFQIWGAVHARRR